MGRVRVRVRVVTVQSETTAGVVWFDRCSKELVELEQQRWCQREVHHNGDGNGDPAPVHVTSSVQWHSSWLVNGTITHVRWGNGIHHGMHHGSVVAMLCVDASRIVLIWTQASVSSQ
jgi:hypothetical protein